MQFQYRFTNFSFIKVLQKTPKTILIIHLITQPSPYRHVGVYIARQIKDPQPNIIM